MALNDHAVLEPGVAATLAIAFVGGAGGKCRGNDGGEAKEKEDAFHGLVFIAHETFAFSCLLFCSA